MNHSPIHTKASALKRGIGCTLLTDTVAGPWNYWRNSCVLQQTPSSLWIFTTTKEIFWFKVLRTHFRYPFSSPFSLWTYLETNEETLPSDWPDALWHKGTQQYCTFQNNHEKSWYLIFHLIVFSKIFHITLTLFRCHLRVTCFKKPVSLHLTKKMTLCTYSYICNNTMLAYDSHW